MLSLAQGPSDRLTSSKKTLVRLRPSRRRYAKKLSCFLFTFFDQALAFDARLTAHKLQCDWRFAGKFFNQLGQPRGVRDDPELGVLSSVDQLTGQWLKKVRMEAGFRLIQRE